MAAAPKTINYPKGQGRPKQSPVKQSPVKQSPAKQTRTVRTARTAPKAARTAPKAAHTAPRLPKPPSQLEADFLAVMAALASDLPPFEREFRYALPRQFRADFAWPRACLLIEMEGGVFGGKSGHNTGMAIERDCERSRLASLFGYRVFRITRKSLDENPRLIVEHLRQIHLAWEVTESIQAAREDHSDD